jgi:hypothetical protein
VRDNEVVCAFVSPTHWMPLPTLPKKRATP